MRLRDSSSGLLCALITIAAPGAARADCVGPSGTILWSYPDESTTSIPPDAVLWAVADGAETTVEVDGVPLTPLGSEGPARRQFSPAAPLSIGQHELVARSDTGAGDAGAALNERRIRFEVAAVPVASGDVTVEAVTIYPVTFGATGDLVSPPADEYDTSCLEAAVSLQWSCDDIIPFSLAQIEYESEGDPIAYLVQGGTLVPAGCPMFWTRGSADSDPASFRAAAVLPTGLGEEHAFTGSIEDRTLRDIYPERFAEQKSGMCSFQTGGGRGTSGLLLLVLAAGGWAARRSICVKTTARSARRG